MSTLQTVIDDALRSRTVQELSLGFVRYETVRRLTSRSFSHLCDVNLTGSGTFDSNVDSITKKCKESGKTPSVVALEMGSKQVKPEHKSEIQSLCIEWAEAHNHLEKLCVKHGYSQEEVDGSKNFHEPVPSIEDLADMLAAKIEVRKRTT